MTEKPMIMGTTWVYCMECWIAGCQPPDAMKGTGVQCRWRGEAEHLLRRGGFSQRKSSSSSWRRWRPRTERPRSERRRWARTRGARDVTEGEEHDAHHEDRRGEPPFQLYFLPTMDGEGH